MVLFFSLEVDVKIVVININNTQYAVPAHKVGVLSRELDEKPERIKIGKNFIPVIDVSEKKVQKNSFTELSGELEKIAKEAYSVFSEDQMEKKSDSLLSELSDAKKIETVLEEKIREIQSFLSESVDKMEDELHSLKQQLSKADEIQKETVGELEKSRKKHMKMLTSLISFIIEKTIHDEESSDSSDSEKIEKHFKMLEKIRTDSFQNNGGLAKIIKEIFS